MLTSCLQEQREERKKERKKKEKNERTKKALEVKYKLTPRLQRSATSEQIEASPLAPYSRFCSKWKGFEASLLGSNKKKKMDQDGHGDHASREAVEPPASNEDVDGGCHEKAEGRREGKLASEVDGAPNEEPNPTVPVPVSVPDTDEVPRQNEDTESEYGIERGWGDHPPVHGRAVVGTEGGYVVAGGWGGPGGHPPMYGVGGGGHDGGPNGGNGGGGGYGVSIGSGNRAAKSNTIRIRNVFDHLSAGGDMEIASNNVSRSDNVISVALPPANNANRTR